MSKPPALLGPDGIALAPGRRAAASLNGSRGVPYDAADIWSQQMALWRPPLWSPDTELNPYRDRIVSRVRDMVRNDGWASGTVTRVLDNAVGAVFRPVSKPDYRALAQMTGISAFDATWAAEFGRAIDAHWRMWAEDDARYCDVERMLTFSQQCALAFRHKLVDGDALAYVRWMPKRLGLGRARYATAVQIIDPDRLSNPQQRFDLLHTRGGVEIDDDGAPIAYHIRRAHQGDWFNAPQSVIWDRIPRETAWGRPIIVHDFDHDRAAQHRGGAGILTPVLQRLKMLVKYDSAELDASILNAIFSAYVECNTDPQMITEALGGEGEGEEASFLDARLAHHESRPALIGEARIPIMFPGDKIQTVSAARPNANFRDFERAVLNNVASGAGVAAFQVSNDWSDVNYSSARGALLEAWKTLHRRRTAFGIGYAAPIRSAWLEEVMDVETLPLPAGAPEFMEARAAFARARWLGPGRGWVDPVAEKQGAVIGMDAGLSTLEDEAAENVGADWEELLDQRAIEIQAFKDRNIPVPEWGGQMLANDAVKKPEAQ